jgi:hypothetical protein
MSSELAALGLFFTQPSGSLTAWVWDQDAVVWA